MLFWPVYSSFKYFKTSSLSAGFNVTSVGGDNEHFCMCVFSISQGIRLLTHTLEYVYSPDGIYFVSFAHSLPVQRKFSNSA